MIVLLLFYSAIQCPVFIGKVSTREWDLRGLYSLQVTCSEACDKFGTECMSFLNSITHHDFFLTQKDTWHVFSDPQPGMPG